MTSQRAAVAGILFLCLHLALPVRQASGRELPGGAMPRPPLREGERTAAAVPARKSTAVRLRPALAASVLLLGSTAAILEIQSDRAYARYLDTADPRRMDSFYDTSERKRSLSTAALVGAELSAVALVVTYLFEKPEAEPQPGSVIIGLSAAPGRLAVRVGW